MAKIGRNDPCPCGSGLKYKRCCGKNTNTVTQETELARTEISKLIEPLTPSIENQLSINIHRARLEEYPHIREYRNSRHIHQEIIESMINYYQSGMFTKIFQNDWEEATEPRILYSIKSSFDLNTQLGSHAFYDMYIYKCSPNANCITEEYLNKNRYRKPEKIEMLQAMLDSSIGLFDIMSVDIEKGFVYIQNVFTEQEFRITDTSMSMKKDPNIFIYARIITYGDISFFSGLVFTFRKDDPYILRFIEEEKKDYKPFGESTRFMKLYNRFTIYPDRRVISVANIY